MNFTPTETRFCPINLQKVSTCLRVNREVWLAMEDAVHHSSTVSVGGVICICGCHLRHIRPCGKRVGRHIDLDFICFLVRLKSKPFQVHQFTDQSHLTQ